MISQADLRKKAQRPWSTGLFLRRWLDGETIFPLEIPFKTPAGKTLSREFAEVRKWIETMEANSRDSNGYGYTIDYQAVNHRLLGPQRLPQRVYFDDPQGWLKFIGQADAFARFQAVTALTRKEQPELLPFLREKPMEALAHQADWPRLLTISRWFVDHPTPGIYLRQLDIPGIDTKFVESRKKILSALLDRVLDQTHIKSQVSGMAKHGFERRFGLKFDPPLIRLRILDPRLAIDGFTDLSLPVADVAAAEFRAATVFITENKINGLAFPMVDDAVIIFGLGYGIEMLSQIDWLISKQIYYWGDIDTHGYAMLSQLRHYFPQTRSLLMDVDTLMQHRHLWGEEPAGKRFVGDLPNLTTSESEVFLGLKESLWQPYLRLEQEHISYSHLLAALDAIQI